MPINQFNFKTATLEGQLPEVLGDVIFVDSSTGNANGDGSSLRPINSLVNASNKSGLSAGDTIVLLPGHTETISSSSALTLDVAGVRVVGLGRGTRRPTFTLGTATSATVNIQAANISIENCVFVANFADIAAAFTLTTAQGLTLIDVECRDTSAILNFLLMIDTGTTTDTASDLTLIRCKRLGAGATAATSIIKMDGTNARLRVKDCYFAHKCTDDAALFMPIASGKIVTDMEVDGCVFNFVGVSSASGGILITTDGSTNSGYIKNSFVKHLDTTSEIMCTASSGFIFMDLKASAVADKQGYLVPGADS